MDKGQRLDVAAEVARGCISRTLDVRVDSNDTGGKQGAHDLILTHGGRTIAVEVKLVVDPSHRAAGTKSSQLGYTRHKGLSYSWIVQLDPDVIWRPTLARLPDLLPELEERGYRPESAHFMWHQDIETYLKLHSLGVDGISCIPPTEMHPPGYYVLQASWGGVVPEVDGAVSAACDLIASPRMTKLRKQLSDAKTDERHAFLIYGWEYLEAVPFSQEGPLPTVEPALPLGIDGVWLSSTATSSPAIAWLPDRGWIRAAPMD
ncbi:hypothetical protein OG552_25270 [Streptomyces sp. NBC_01476]|uniref:hypothetical protein n=1 Tax=Streptomyces sp. NBC_01476 TaxID=2903881 RepID=UPI002E33B8BA|nr:hypothetical protein [Streptomyces sp. NBC_01476]